MACTTSANCRESDGFGDLLQGTCTAAGVCDYNTCTTDANCPSPSEVCSCQGQTSGDGKYESLCVPADCHVDADCGQSGYCSPTPTPCGGSWGFYCHTCADTCINDSDCQADPAGAAFCVYLDAGHWECTNFSVPG